MTYHEQSEYVPLLQSAFPRWRELESESGQRLMHMMSEGELPIAARL